MKQSKLNSLNIKCYWSLGRMFKAFYGNVYLLDKPPVDDETQLTIEFS